MQNPPSLLDRKQDGMEATARNYQQVSQQSEREQRILDHLEYVRHVVGRLVAGLPFGTDVDNLMSAGTLGLVEAANSYDSSRGVVFTTFAYPRIRGAIIDELRRNCPREYSRTLRSSERRLRRSLPRQLRRISQCMQN